MRNPSSKRLRLASTADTLPIKSVNDTHEDNNHNLSQHPPKGEAHNAYVARLLAADRAFDYTTEVPPVHTPLPLLGLSGGDVHTHALVSTASPPARTRARGKKPVTSVRRTRPATSRPRRTGVARVVGAPMSSTGNNPDGTASNPVVTENITQIGAVRARLRSRTSVITQRAEDDGLVYIPATSTALTPSEDDDVVVVTSSLVASSAHRPSQQTRTAARAPMASFVGRPQASALPSYVISSDEEGLISDLQPPLLKSTSPAAAAAAVAMASTTVDAAVDTSVTPKPKEQQDVPNVLDIDPQGGREPSSPVPHATTKDGTRTESNAVLPSTPTASNAEPQATGGSAPVVATPANHPSSEADPVVTSSPKSPIIPARIPVTSAAAQFVTSAVLRQPTDIPSTAQQTTRETTQEVAQKTQQKVGRKAGQEIAQGTARKDVHDLPQVDTTATQAEGNLPTPRPLAAADKSSNPVTSLTLVATSAVPLHTQRLFSSPSEKKTTVRPVVVSLGLQKSRGEQPSQIGQRRAIARRDAAVLPTPSASLGTPVSSGAAVQQGAKTGRKLREAAARTLKPTPSVDRTPPVQLAQPVEATPPVQPTPSVQCKPLSKCGPPVEAAPSAQVIPSRRSGKTHPTVAVEGGERRGAGGARATSSRRAGRAVGRSKDMGPSHIGSRTRASRAAAATQQATAKRTLAERVPSPLSPGTVSPLRNDVRSPGDAASAPATPRARGRSGDAGDVAEVGAVMGRMEENGVQAFGTAVATAVQSAITTGVPATLAPCVAQAIGPSLARALSGSLASEIAAALVPELADTVGRMVGGRRVDGEEEDEMRQETREWKTEMKAEMERLKRRVTELERVVVRGA